MDLNTKDMLKKKILDTQEMVRDFEVYSKKVDDDELSSTFKEFALESGIQARKLMDLLDKMEN